MLITDDFEDGSVSDFAAADAHVDRGLSRDIRVRNFHLRKAFKFYFELLRAFSFNSPQ